MAHGVRPTTTLDHLLVALGHPTRRAMLEALSEGPVLQSTLACLSPTAATTALKHVDLLQRAGLVTKTKTKGNHYAVELDMAPINELLAWLSTLYPDPDSGEPDTARPMTFADTQIRDAVEAFVIQISGLVRQAALEAATEAVGAALRRRRPPRA